MCNALNDKDATFLGCGHAFHTICINSWMIKNSNCPICRTKIESCINNREAYRDIRIKKSLAIIDNAFAEVKNDKRSFGDILFNVQKILHPSVDPFVYISEKNDFVHRSSFMETNLINPIQNRGIFS